MSLIALVLFAACGLFKVEHRLRVDIEGKGNVYPYMGRFEDGTIVTFDIEPEGIGFLGSWSGPNRDDVQFRDDKWSILMDSEKRLTAVFCYDTATVSGYVTDTRGGPAVEGATVSIEGWVEVTTDADGFFITDMAPADVEFDLIVKKDGETRAVVQDIYLEADGVMELEIPIKDSFHPGWSMTPPRIEVEGVQRGDTVSGDLPISVTLAGDLDGFVFYVYFCGWQRHPVEFYEIDSNEGEGIIDTTLFPNGDGFVRILAYDTNENVAMVIIPVTIDNDLSGVTEVPEDLAVLCVESTSYGETFGYYSKDIEEARARFRSHTDPRLQELRERRPADFVEMPHGSTVLNEVWWFEVEGADGYHVYRSFDGENYRWIGDVTGDYYNDYSPQLPLGGEVYYKVVPYNGAGDGNGLVRSVTILEPFNVYLLEPANEATDVPLDPTFTWTTDVEFDEDVDLAYKFFIIFAAKPLGLEVWVGETEVELEGLEPGAVHSWDILAAEAYLVCSDDANGYSDSLALAGDENGSINGDFIFTTTTDVE